ncbi:MAG: hypothetical protein IJH77_06710 [Mogibacterium sp.]|nr:hypothetical protein [Mogibacterium sp.]
MEQVRLRKKSGQEEVFLIRRCCPEDYGQIVALQDTICEGMPDDGVFVRIGNDHFAESLREDYCIGAYCGEEIAAFSLMVVNRRSKRNYARYAGYPEERMEHCVSMDLTMVHPDYRGYGLQRLFTEYREEEAIRLGATEAFVTISPGNVHSLANLTASGYEIIRTMDLYDGHPRHILRKYLTLEKESENV